jgi:photosystem II stability/assembly factor-like uncharacterized protein
MVSAAPLIATSVAAQNPTPIPAQALDGFRFRSIGPAVTGGRIHDVEVHPSDPATILIGTASGGIWKTTNKGTTWKPVFDDKPVSTFGDLAMAPSNPLIVYAGTGEQNNRQSTSWGNGIYRSDDGGDTWRHVGLDGTLHIGRVVVHPNDPNTVYVAALGNLWKDSPERGIYRSTDGGSSWEQVLFVDAMTGFVELVIDPENPNVLVAAAYQRQRRAWGFNGGGPGSGIYRTMDGGDTWERVTDGIPEGDMGRIGLAISRSSPNVLNALIEHADAGGTYRSVDGGRSWERMGGTDPRPMYYSHIFIDPTDDLRVYVIGTNPLVSEDGGRSFDRLPYQPTYDVGVHSDFHSMWINPDNPKHFYLVGDGGFHETWDRGLTFTKINNMAIGQFYAIGVDNRDPYYIYGGMQDNHSWAGPSATRRWIGIINDDWNQIGFGDGMYWQPDPTNHRYVYGASNGGSYTRLDAETGDLRSIGPIEPEDDDYRWDWTSPSLVSRHDSRVVYIGGNRLFTSRDRGESWSRSDDLSKQIDRDTLAIMRVAGSNIRLSRNDGTSSFGEITTIAESPVDPQVLWVGLDDGNVQVSRDGGGSWQEVGHNAPSMSHTYVSRVMASGSGAGVAYVTFDAHRDGDFAPYAFRTTDFGRSWTAITNGLDPIGSVNVVVEHPDNSDLLFLGTEHALFVSTTAGSDWVKFSANLPTTAYDDMVIHAREKDLVLGTHGRSIWILDDVTPLAEWSQQVASVPAHLFSTRQATMFHYWKATSYRAQGAYAAENPAEGAFLTYYLGAPASSAMLTITNPSGTVVRTIEGPTGPGFHRVMWDLRHEPPTSGGFGGGSRDALPVPAHPLGARGPFVSPGEYAVVLEANGVRSESSVNVRGDPAMPVTDDEWREREAFLLAVEELRAEISAHVDASSQQCRGGRFGGGGQTEDADPIQQLCRIRNQIGRISSALNGSGVRQGTVYPPTATQRERFEELAARAGALMR